MKMPFIGLCERFTDLIKKIGLRLSRRRIDGAPKVGESRSAGWGNQVKIYAQINKPEATGRREAESRKAARPRRVAPNNRTKFFAKANITFVLILLSAFAVFAETPSELRVLSYNIHAGIGMDKKLDLERTAKVILDQKPDLVALQEVDRLTRRTGKIDQTAELARLTGMEGVHGKTIDYEGGDYGVAILSKYPILEYTMYALPQEALPPDRPPVEARGLLCCTIQIGDRKIDFLSTHLCVKSAANRLMQAERINRIVTENKKENVVMTILAGDFNANPKSDVIAAFLRHWADLSDPAPTAGSVHPKSKIDFIFGRPIDPSLLLSSQVIAEPVASDHRPVLSVIRLPSP